MKNRAIKIMVLNTLLVLSTIHLYSQNKEGLYLTAGDFANNNLTHSCKDTRIKLHEVFKKDLVEVKCNDSLYAYNKKDVFGYRDSDGKTYRFYDGKIYPIANPNETILIYKVSNGMATKGQAQTFSYYFSKNASASIIPLSMTNLQNSFSDNKVFQEILEIHFNDSSDLLEYDRTHKMYKLNRLLEIAKNREI